MTNVVVVLAALLTAGPSHGAVGEVVIESGVTRLTVHVSPANSEALLTSISNKETGESAALSPDSADFALTTDKGEFKAADFKVRDVVSNDRVTYIVMEGESLDVTQRFEAWPSGCVKRSLELFAKTPIRVEKVSLIDLKLAQQPERSVNHQARFLVLKKGGVMLTVEMPMPSRNVRLTSDGRLKSEYEPMRQLEEGESFETVPAVYMAWTGDILAGFDKHRDYTYELSGWREYATVTASSESHAALTTAYDAYKAVDDDPTTRWRSEKSLDGRHWIEIEFPEPVRFDTMELKLDNPDFRPVLETPPAFEKWRLQVWSESGWRDVAAGTEAPGEPVRLAETRAAGARLVIEGCVERFSVWDLRLYKDLGKDVIPENVCSRFWVDRDVRMPFTYFNTWYIRHPGIGRLQRARGLLTYDKVLPLIPPAAQCGLDNFVLDSGWKYMWYGIGRNPKWEVEFPDGERPFAEAARRAGITLAGWHYFFWLEGEKRDIQWRALNKNGSPQRQMCLLSGYYDWVKREMLDRIRNDGMLLMKIDGFVPPEECWATDHDHKPGSVRDATWLKFMQLAEEIKRQYPRFRLGVYTWDPFWLKYSEIVHTYEDHGGLTRGELAPTRARMNYMHDREMFNEAYWRYLIWNQVEGSMIISDKTPEWREEVIGNLAGPTRRQISTDLGTFTAEERNWIRDCLAWSRKNARFLERFRPFFPNASVKEPWGLERCRDLEKNLGIDVLESNTLEGYAHIDQNEGYVFVFNPTFHGAKFAVPITAELGFDKEAKGLTAQVIYPYFENLGPGSSAQGNFGLAFGDVIEGWLPAEKHIVIRIMKQPIRPVLAECRYAVAETIWDRVELEARAEPADKAATVKAKLAPPKGVVFDSLTVNGRAVPACADGSYEFALQVPVRGQVETRSQPAVIKNGRKTISTEVVVKGDLSDGRLMLFLMRRIPSGRDRLEKAAPGELDFRLLVNGKPLEGELGDTLDKDWENEKNAGWWVFGVPSDSHRFVVSLECSEKVRPVLVYSAVQDSKAARLVGYYSREKNSGKLTAEDSEAFFHGAFPEEREYYPVIDLEAI